MSQTIVFNTIPFSLEKVSQINDSTLLVTFTNNPLAQNSVNTNDGLNPNNYTLSGPAINYVTSVNTTDTDLESLILNLKNPLVTGSWTIGVANIQDVDFLDLSNPKTLSLVVDYSNLQPSLSQGANNHGAADIINEHITPMFKNKPGWNAFIAGIAQGDEYITKLAQDIYDQLFLSSATGKYLTRKASDNGFNKPKGVGLSDEIFRKLAIKVGAEKVTLQSFLQILEIYYGEDALRASIDCNVEERYDLTDGDSLLVKIDGVSITVIFNERDFTILNQATAKEVASTITREFENNKLNAYAKPVLNSLNGKYFVRIYSGALGLRGTVSVTGGSASNTFQFPNGTFTLNSKQRLSVAIQPSSDASCEIVLPVTTQIVTRKEGSGAYLYSNDKISILSPVQTSLLSRLADVVTVTTTSPHNLLVGDTFFFGPGSNNFPVGVKTITEIVSSTVFKYNEVGFGTDESLSNYVCPNYRQDGVVKLTTTAPHGILTGQKIITDNLRSFLGVKTSISVTDLGVFPGDSTIKSDAGTALLPDGRVLIVGGGSDSATNNKLYIFDSSDNSLNYQGDLGYNYIQGTTTTLANGQVLITGGNSDNTPIAKIFDPLNNVILDTSPPSTNRFQATSTLLQNNKVFIIAGTTDYSDLLQTTEFYDPATSTWSSGPSLSQARRLHTATLLKSGTVLVVGGATGVDPTPSELYNSNNNTWHTVADIPTYRSNHTATLLDNDKVMIVGGIGIGLTVISNTEIYSDSTESWVSGGTNGEIGVSLSDHTTVKLPNSDVLLLGGQGDTAAVAENVWIYNYVLDRWTKPSYTIWPRSHLNSVLLPNGSVYVSPGDSTISDLYNNDQNVFSSGNLTGIFNVTSLNSHSISYNTENKEIAVIESVDSSVGSILPFKAEEKSFIGPYIFEPNSLAPAITSIKCLSAQHIDKDESISILNVDNTDGFYPNGGYLILNFGREEVTAPIHFYSVISPTQLSIDSSFKFPYNVEIGTEFIQLKQLGSYVPPNPETIGCFYITDSSSGREAASNTIDDVAAVGIGINKIITYPGTDGLGNGTIPLNSTGPKLNDAIYIWGSEEDVKKNRGF